jgi:hypothetical protein
VVASGDGAVEDVHSVLLQLGAIFVEETLLLEVTVDLLQEVALGLRPRRSLHEKCEAFFEAIALDIDSESAVLAQISVAFGKRNLFVIQDFEVFTLQLLTDNFATIRMGNFTHLKLFSHDSDTN